MFKYVFEGSEAAVASKMSQYTQNVDYKWVLVPTENCPLNFNKTHSATGPTVIKVGQVWTSALTH